ncbi:hypothetical protein ABW20_dc0105380 [Dactylellina cionopaga]|nr:hypothetical protein ABW20_dc0105380 [Dactylellina cionopaga]
MPRHDPVLMMLGTLFFLLGYFVTNAIALAPAVVGHQQPVVRDRISTYNVSFDSDEFDNLGDLDWRPIGGPYQGLVWKNFRVGANKHFFQTAGGKDAFATIPLDVMTREIIHTADPALSCIYNDSDVSSFNIKSLLFGCALYSGIPVECDIEFQGIDETGKKVASQNAKFTPPYARLNDKGRLEAGKASLQSVTLNKQFSKISELRFIVQKFTVLFGVEPKKQGQPAAPLDVVYSNSLLLVLDGVSYSTNGTKVPDTIPTPSARDISIEKRGDKHVTDCFDLQGSVTFNSLPIPYKDILYDGFYRTKHFIGAFDDTCYQKPMNASTGHLYAPGVVAYTNPAASIFPSIGIDYFGSKRTDMSIKSFYIGCEQFLDDNSIMETTTPCTIGIVSLLRQKQGTQPQEVHYQEVSIAKPQGEVPEDDGFEFVELIDGHHVTKVYFVLVSADEKAQSVAIIIDNLTYYTRKGKGPQTGNKSVAAPANAKVNDIIQAISKSYERTITGQNQPVTLRARGNGVTKGNATFSFESPGNVNPSTGIFPLTPGTTGPFYFGPEWKGRSQDAHGNPQQNTVRNNITWPFGPVDSDRLNFAYAEIPWASRGTKDWDTAKAVIKISSDAGFPKFNMKELTTVCYPAIITDEDKKRLDMLNNVFECHYTVLGYKLNFQSEPAEHAIDFAAGRWEDWRHDKFPSNFRDVDILEFHVTYASTRNVRLFVDDIKYELV